MIGFSALRVTVVLALAGLCGCVWHDADHGQTTASRLGVEELARESAAPLPPLLLDVRTPGEFAEGHLPGAVNIPHYAVPLRMQALDTARDRGVVVYCEAGVRSAKVATFLEAEGFPAVRDFSGGMRVWRRSGKPVAR